MGVLTVCSRIREMFDFTAEVERSTCSTILMQSNEPAEKPKEEPEEHPRENKAARTRKNIWPLQTYQHGTGGWANRS